jgi:hypothetical protein
VVPLGDGRDDLDAPHPTLPQGVGRHGGVKDGIVGGSQLIAAGAVTAPELELAFGDLVGAAGRGQKAQQQDGEEQRLAACV